MPLSYRLGALMLDLSCRSLQSSPAESGKFARLAEIAEVVASRQEKALVFTQFREMTGPLARFLGEAFGRPGLVLSGDTKVRERAELVRRFQEDEAIPFFCVKKPEAPYARAIMTSDRPAR